MSNTIQHKILAIIKQFNENYNDQVNLSSESAQQDLAEMITSEIQNDTNVLETYNKDQLEFFTNLEQDLHK